MDSGGRRRGGANGVGQGRGLHLQPEATHVRVGGSCLRLHKIAVMGIPPLSAPT